MRKPLYEPDTGIHRTNGKFGKNRPFIVLGQLFMVVGTALIFLLVPSLPQAGRLPFYIVCYMFYIVGYTFQCVVTKSAQTCLTNDPKQRPVFSVFDSLYSLIYYTGLTMFVTSFLVPKYNITNAAGEIQTSAFYTPGFYVNLWVICALVSAVLAVLAVIGLWRKDRSEFYGTGEAQRLKLRDYWETIRNNRAIQMLIVSACSDKLTLSMQSNSVVMMMLMFVATRLGQKKALVAGTWGGIIGAAAMFALLFFGNPQNVNFSPINLYTVGFLAFFILMKGMGSLSGSIVIPMTADCADYEVYRSGKYVPGLMGTLFSFIDKLISSLATTIIGLLLALIGFRSQQPTQTTPYSSGIFWVTIICFVIAPAIGWILNIIAMKFYPLTREKMAEIQERIAEIKGAAGRNQ